MHEKGTMNPNELKTFFPSYTKVMVSAINQLSSAIAGAVFQASVWPPIWPRCDYSLGKSGDGPHRTGNGVA